MTSAWLVDRQWGWVPPAEARDYPIDIHERSIDMSNARLVIDNRWRIYIGSYWQSY